MSEVFWQKNFGEVTADARKFAREDGQQPRFNFDLEVCRRIFQAYDRDRSGYLEISELASLAQELWAKFHPECPQLSQDMKMVRILFSPVMLFRENGIIFYS